MPQSPALRLWVCVVERCGYGSGLPEYASVLAQGGQSVFLGTAAEGLGSPHAGLGTIWPLGIIGRALISTDEKEIAVCLAALKATHAGTEFIHEAFDRNDAKRFTRMWFAWANTLFGELILTVAAKYPRPLRG